MKHTLTILLLLLTSLQVSATNVSGGIYTNTTWTLSNSPYIVTSDIVVFEGARLLIEPGVEVLVNNNCIIEVRGQIAAIGKVAKKIVIKGNTTGNELMFWRGIVFIGTSDPLGRGDQAFFSHCNISNAQTCFDFNVAYHGPYIFKNCTFNYNNHINNDGGMGRMLFDSCRIVNNNYGFSYFQFGGRIANCVFDNNINGAEGSDTIVNCSFTNHSGIALQPYGYTKNCELRNNNTAVKCLFNSVNNTFTNNKIHDNTVGIEIRSYFNGSILFRDNEICDNEVYNVKLMTNNNCNISGNCWCSTDSVAIRSKIYDGYTDISRGLVTFGPVHTVCNFTVGVKTYANTASVNVYPNPVIAGDWLHIRSSVAVDVSKLKMIDVMGRVHSFDTYSGSNKDVAIKPADVVPGVYFITAPTLDGAQVISKSIVVQ